MRALSALSACLLLTAAAQPGWARPQAAPAAAGTPALRVGVFDQPCREVEPLPAEVFVYMAKVMKAKAAKLPPPAPSPEGAARYQAWQARQLQQDFAQLCHYDAGNAALAPASDHRVIFFGDSITEFWGAQDPSLFKNDRIDRGISGQTTTQMLGRFRQDVIALHPRVVHIIAGTNDIAGNTGPTSLAWIEDNISTMVELARANNIRVVLGSVPPAARFDWRPYVQPADTIVGLNSWLRAYAAKQGLQYVDYYSALVDEKRAFRASLSDDGVHPNAQGYAVMRPLAEAAITHALVRKR